MSAINETDDAAIDFDGGDEPDMSLAADPENEFESTQNSPGTRAAKAARPLSAWQRLEERKDDAWLRDQLADWDDWDEDSGAH